MIYHRPHRPKTVELSRSLRSCGGLGAIRRYDRSKADWMDDDVEDEWVDYEELDDGFRSEDGSSSKSYVDTIQVCVDSGDDLQIVSLFDEKEDAVRKRSQGGEVFHSTTNRDGDLRLTPASGLKGLSSYQVGNRGIQRGSELIPCERQEQDDKLVGQQGIQEVTKDVLGGGISTVMAKSDTLSKPSQLVSTEAGDLERGKDVSAENMHQGFTHVFESTFESMEGVAEYVAHPAHVEFANEFLPCLEKVVVIDYKPTTVCL